ncbi:MAG: iron-dicitrate ABC transporter ATP-binding protein [Phycisphaerae bacterium]|nr:MAG: iron-dicitrate ABC transporter ATP-binding protein [Phycisphaerae bacterium]
MTADPAIMQVRGLRFGYAPNRTFLGPIELDVHRGRMLAVVGPNGAGKSTLLRLIAGLTSPNAGEIRFADKPLDSMSARERARHITFLPQKPIAPSSTSATEIVSLGRHPHRRFGLFESPTDKGVIEQSMQQTSTTTLAERRMDTLSGGEAQRVHLAAALAQQPEVLILDEPTAELDLRFQLQIFELLRELTDRENLATIVVTHDLNLARRFADDALLLSAGHVAANGPADTVLVPETLEAVYGVGFETAMCGDQTWLLAQNPIDEDSATIIDDMGTFG